MGRERGTAASAATSSQSAAVQKHKKRTKYGDRDRGATGVAKELIAKPLAPKLKYHSYFEFQENTDKKKKLEFQVTNAKTPQPGFTFVPVGNPELTNFCKELSRDEDALIFIVSATKEKNLNLVDHVHRIGYHFRSYIVDQAALALGGLNANHHHDTVTKISQRPDEIPESQEEINKQADAAIRDLYPRIPNTDREMIIQHAFQKGAVFHGKPVVGLQSDLTLSRRVQLAVSAHIRHQHTRYDHLLRETDWAKARKTVEGLCLDILLKWRGDEETGRDQLDEILREVVVISDSESESDSSDEEDGASLEEDDETIERGTSIGAQHSTTLPRRPVSNTLSLDIAQEPRAPTDALRTRRKTKAKLSKNARMARRGFRRYQAWEEAQKRRQELSQDTGSSLGGVSRQAMRRQDPIAQPVTENHYMLPERQLNFRDQLHESSHIHKRTEQQWPFERAPIIQSVLSRPEEYHREQVFIRTPPEGAVGRGQINTYDSRDLRVFRERTPVARSSFAPARSRVETRLASPRPIEDVPLPSVEPIDLSGDSPGPRKSYAHTYTAQDPYRQKVMYSIREPESEFSTHPLSRSDVVYINDDSPPKRRRVMISHDYPEGSVPEENGFVRIISRPQMMATSYPPPRSDDRIRDRSEYNVRRLPNDSEFDGSQLRPSSEFRVVRRLTEHESSLRRDPLDERGNRILVNAQHSHDPHVSLMQRPQGQIQYESTRPLPMAYGTVQGDGAHSQPTRPRLPIGQERISQLYPQRVAGERFSDFSAFSSHPLSQETRSAQIPARVAQYDVPISRSITERESHLSSTRGEYGAVNSIPYRRERLPPRGSERYAADRSEHLRPSEYQNNFEIIPLEIQEPSSHGRIREARQSFPSADPTGPMYIDRVSRRNEVIVLE